MKVVAVAVAALAVVAALLTAPASAQFARKLVAAKIINPLETNEVHKRAVYVQDVLVHEPAAAMDHHNEDFQKEDTGVGIDDATLMGVDTCEKLPSERKSKCQMKREARLKAERLAAEKEKADKAAEDK